MKFKEFKQVNLEIWNKYLGNLFQSITKGKLQLENGTLLFPNIMLLSETNDHFVLELFGAKRIFNGLKVKTHNKEPSTLTYLYQFDSEQEGPTFHLNGNNNGFTNLWVSREIDYEALRKRFGFQDKWLTRLRFKGGKGALFSFGKEFESCFMNNCFIVNRFCEIYRVKHILHMVIINKKQTKQEYSKDFLERSQMPWRSTNDLFGVHFCESELDQGYMLAGQFANIFLLPRLRETTIGEFLENNPVFAKKAFSCRRSLYEPEFQWVEGNPDPTEKSIKPDLMLERVDGYFDICDLKTASLDRQRITKGRHRRRRFIDYVEEGIAQLANYEEYFKFKKNKEFAQSHYDVKVSKPNLFLIVGSYENATKEEIEEAVRRLKPNYRIIDYDTLNTLFLRSFTKEDV